VVGFLFQGIVASAIDLLACGRRAPGILLNDVRQFMRDQFPARLGIGLIFALGKVNVIARGEGSGMNRASGLGSGGVGVHQHSFKLAAEL